MTTQPSSIYDLIPSCFKTTFVLCAENEIKSLVKTIVPLLPPPPKIVMLNVGACDDIIDLDHYTVLEDNGRMSVLCFGHTKSNVRCVRYNSEI